MYLSVVIPSYRTTEEGIFPLLASIRCQLAVSFSDIEVIIVHDGDDAFREEFLSLFHPLNIRQVMLKENGGPGVARQAGIDEARGKYLMFCDSDDVLQNVGALSSIILELKKTNPVMLITQWMEEVLVPDGTYQYVIHDGEYTWMHGKAIDRGFLIRNNIRHHPQLRVHEDTYFISLITTKTTRISVLGIISYVWKYRRESITRRNNAIYSFESLPEFIFSFSEANKLIETYNPRAMYERIVDHVTYIYFVVHSAEWAAEDKTEYRGKTEEAFARYIATYWHYWQDASVEMKLKSYNESRRIVTGNMAMETETLGQWLARIGFDSGNET